jgi:hypothetical protein
MGRPSSRENPIHIMAGASSFEPLPSVPLLCAMMAPESSKTCIVPVALLVVKVVRGNNKLARSGVGVGVAAARVVEKSSARNSHTSEDIRCTISRRIAAI